MSEKVYLLGPDLGNSYTDVVNLAGNTISIPSWVSPGRALGYQYVFDGEQQTVGASSYLDNLWIEDDDGVYFIGYSAYEKQRKDQVKLSHDTDQSLVIKRKLLRASMGFVLPQKAQVKLVLGHPHNESNVVPAMKDMALGLHEYSLNGRDYFHEVVEVEVFSQPVMAVRGVMADYRGNPKPEHLNLLDIPVAFGDIGGGTFDVCWIERNMRTGKLEVHDYLSGSTRRGVWHALELIQELIKIKFRVEIPLATLAYELIEINIPRGFYKPPVNTMISIAGEKVDIADIKEAAFAEAANDDITYLTNLWPASERDRLGKMFWGGGGSALFEKHLTPLLQKLFGGRFEYCPRHTIAIGQQNKSTQLWGRY